MTLSDESTERITLLYAAARRNGSLVSVQELSRLLPEVASESEVEAAILSDTSLSSKFELKSGYLTERNEDPQRNPLLLEAESRRVARANLSHASKLVPLLLPCRFQIVAVSGSTSYGSASLSRDADLFCVSPPGRMWVSLAKGLIIARAYGLVNRRAPNFCLSCVMDEAYARSVFRAQRHPLFARDALEAKVMMGRDHYKSLLRTAGWISDYFPVAYREAISDSPEASKIQGRQALARILNRLLFLTLGRYIRTKSFLLNRNLKARGRSGDLFRVRCGEDHLIYESRRYIDLRSEYEVAEPA